MELNSVGNWKTQLFTLISFQIKMTSIRQLLADEVRLHKITKAAFDAVDQDHSGYLDRKELEEIFISLADDMKIEKPKKEEVEEIISALDENGDGKISLAEFEVLIKQVLKIMVKMEEDNFLGEQDAD